jgi:hypothetical protein
MQDKISSCKMFLNEFLLFSSFYKHSNLNFPEKSLKNRDDQSLNNFIIEDK